MNEIEWEGSRLPRKNTGGIRGPIPPHGHPLREFLTLEFPREHAAWVLQRPLAESSRGKRIRWSSFRRARNRGREGD
ncbi:MAG TPA: hypothetical protein VEH57_07430 [Thermoplasmata archaeon]|nr:hypothetical protein [Thermoplasmata archaeon]